jgi:hypothetical protein
MQSSETNPQTWNRIKRTKFRQALLPFWKKKSNSFLYLVGAARVLILFMRDWLRMRDQRINDPASPQLFFFGKKNISAAFLFFRKLQSYTHNV